MLDLIQDVQLKLMYSHKRRSKFSDCGVIGIWENHFTRHCTDDCAMAIPHVIAVSTCHGQQDATHGPQAGGSQRQEQNTIGTRKPKTTVTLLPCVCVSVCVCVYVSVYVCVCVCVSVFVYIAISAITQIIGTDHVH